MVTGGLALQLWLRACPIHGGRMVAASHEMAMVDGSWVRRGSKPLKDY